MHSDEPLFIAETDELGRIVCVWRSNRNDKLAPRPIKNRTEHLPDLPSAAVFGAPRHQISKWLAMRAD